MTSSQTRDTQNEIFPLKCIKIILVLPNVLHHLLYSVSSGKYHLLPQGAPGIWGVQKIFGRQKGGNTKDFPLKGGTEDFHEKDFLVLCFACIEIC